MDVRPLNPEDVAEVVRIFQSSRAAALPWLPVLHDTEEDLGFFGAQITSGTGWGSWSADRLVGIAFWADGWLNHLYVDPAERGQGHGSALLARALEDWALADHAPADHAPADHAPADHAPADRPEGLRLWAFARNTPAIEFYRRRGFVVIRETDGRDNEEREPDVLMEFVVPNPM